MHLFFADDSRQEAPTRPMMGALVATGGFLIDGDRTKELEARLNKLCHETGFPNGEPFKWSPGRELWMTSKLTGTNRQDFFVAALEAAASLDTKCIVVIEDKTQTRATFAKTSEADVTALLLERIDNSLRRVKQDGLVVVARPQGGRGDEDKFLADCLEVLQSGTEYVKPSTIAVNVLTSPAKLVRCLQLADVITSAATAHIAGEGTYSPPIFEKLKMMFARDTYRINGIGLKLHPDLKYANLYHWLLGDKLIFKQAMGKTLPSPTLPYAKDANTY